MTDISIMWFRQDLRMADNDALISACRHKAVLPIFIFDNTLPENVTEGSASRWWLHYGLKSLDDSLDGCLSVFCGRPLDVLKSLVKKYDVKSLYWNRCYDAFSVRRDSEIKTFFKGEGLVVESFNGSLLWEPWTVTKADGSPYKVFTPFYRRGCVNAGAPPLPSPRPDFSSWIKDDESLAVDDLGLLPKLGWDKTMKEMWTVSEAEAVSRLDDFIECGLSNYKIGRDYPASGFTSGLSPYLHYGQISARQVWYAVKNLPPDENIDTFCSELGWREFSYNLLFFNPDLQRKNIRAKFDFFNWRVNDDDLKAWQKGQTGVPIIDAGMRELWQTGFMHNRVRMLVGSFLVKNLRLHWHHGERWFWDCLVDADLASNSASWQWIAGCGADASPYFRIFNPVTQSEKFDGNGDYVRKFVPELAKLPNKYLFRPWEAPEDVLLSANVELGKTYPHPIVDLKISRQNALDEFKQI